MSRGRVLFTLGESSACNRSAKNLANAFYPSETASIIDLSLLDCFAKLSHSGFDKIVFLAHGNESTFGGYSAHEFAELFNQRYLNSCSKTSKNEVKDIYLIGCDIGYISEETQSSFSQEFANTLFDLGFKNVKIHCIAKPDNAIGDVLHVEVLNCSGAAGLAAYASALAHHHLGDILDVQTGYLKAYLLSQNDADRLKELERNSLKNAKEIVELKHQKSFLLINHAHPEIELSKPHNTFYPNEAALQRKERVLKETARKFPRRQAEAIALLVKQRDHLAQKSPVKLKMMATRLDFLIVQVQLANEKHWPNVVGEYTKYMRQNPAYSSFFHKESNTTRLLTALAKSDFKRANAIIAAHENITSDKKHSRLGLLFTTRKKELPDTAAASMQSRLPGEMTGKIQRLAQELRFEIRKLRSSCFAFFHAYEINTKCAKLDVLNDLLNCNNMDDAKLIASEAVKAPRVMRSMKHTRTKDLLLEVIANKTADQMNSEFFTITPAGEKSAL